MRRTIYFFSIAIPPCFPVSWRNTSDNATLIVKFDAALAVLGSYGIGKTSFCYKLAFDLLGSQYIPVVVMLKYVQLKGWKKAIQEEIVSQTHGKSRSTVLILDGFDELSTKFDKKTMLKEIENMSNTTDSYQKVILTSRTQFFRNIDEEKETLVYRLNNFLKRAPRPLTYMHFERIYISLFNDTQIKQYLRLSIGKKNAEEFWSNIIETVWDMKDLSRRPILLHLIVYEKDAFQNIQGKVTPGRLSRQLQKGGRSGKKKEFPKTLCFSWKNLPIGCLPREKTVFISTP